MLKPSTGIDLDLYLDLDKVPIEVLSMLYLTLDLDKVPIEVLSMLDLTLVSIADIEID